MSGFCGWIGRRGTADPRGTIEHMARALPHHGRIESLNASGETFGLALRSDSATGSFFADSEFVAVIEGYPEWRESSLRDVAEREGHARALIAAYRCNKSTLLDRLRGTFSFAVLDLAAATALCAIDRFGVQTLCYAQPNPDLTVFGSTTDAVREHPAVESTISIQSVFDYFYLVDRVPAPETIYREQRKLAPAEYLTIAPGQTSVAAYWRMPYESSARVDRATAAEELRLRLKQAVKASIAGEDQSRIGAFLSGGLDSSSIVGMAAGLLTKKLRTFTIGFPVDGFDEAHYADLAAKHFRTDHRTYYVQPKDIFEILTDVVQIYDEPFGNSSIVPAYHCARMAKEAGVEVMLAGDGGDELFAGNKRYASDRVFDHYGKLPSILTKRLLEPVSSQLAVAGGSGLLGKVFRYVDQAKRPVPERVTGNIFQTQPPSAVFAADMLREVDTGATLGLLTRIYDAAPNADKVQRMMHLDLRVTLADSDLRKVARMCELAGVRVRFPFLDDDLAEFSARLPQNLLMPEGKLRGFYKEAMRGFLPDEIIDKQKHGFGLPYVAFMNSDAPMRDIVCASLTELKGRHYFRADFIDPLIERSRRGALTDDDGVAWDLVILGLWLESRAQPAQHRGA